MGLSETAGLDLGLQDVPSLGSEVAVNPNFVATNSAAVGPAFAAGAQNLAANFANAHHESSNSYSVQGHSFHKMTEASTNLLSTGHIEKSNAASASQLPPNCSSHVSEAYGTSTRDILTTLSGGGGGQQMQQSQPLLVPSLINTCTSTIPTTMVPATIMNSGVPAPRLGTYHNRNFVQTEAGVQSSVFLVPTVQSDGSVAYAFHHASPQVKIVSPLKACPSIMPFVSLPTPGTAIESVKARPAIVRPANYNKTTRQPPKILPKGTQQHQSITQRPISAGKVIRLASGQCQGRIQEETGSGGGGQLLASKPGLSCVVNENGGFSVVGYSGGDTTNGTVQAAGT